MRLDLACEPPVRSSHHLTTVYAARAAVLCVDPARGLRAPIGAALEWGHSDLYGNRASTESRAALYVEIDALVVTVTVVQANEYQAPCTRTTFHVSRDGGHHWEACEPRSLAGPPRCELIRTAYD